MSQQSAVHPEVGLWPCSRSEHHLETKLDAPALAHFWSFTQTLMSVIGFREPRLKSASKTELSFLLKIQRSQRLVNIMGTINTQAVDGRSPWSFKCGVV